MLSLCPVYSATQVGVATALGGPLGGAWLVALNYKRLDAAEKARTAIVLGVLAMAVVNALVLLASYSMLRLVVMVPGIVMAGLAELLRGDGYTRHVVLGGTRGSNWRAVGVGVACLPIHFMPIVGAAIATSHAYLVK